MPEELVVALIGFGGAILGGAVQSIFSWRQSHVQFVRDSRQRDYGFFVEALAAMSQAKHGTPERTRATALSIEAKAKIILNGSEAVVEALERYSRHEVLSSEQSYRDFCALIAAMRTDVGGIASEKLPSLTRSILFEATSKEAK